ncbi:hypothetical protein PDJAM_G00039710 [Pangasius djambal]|uniref:Uncharacterized protein n=1 Tax=Pangasius djambal TaxID=1691987 RepID=A0ACC5YTC0_9TELE|nr:hypothetical protein [Pangasius djambal]
MKTWCAKIGVEEVKCRAQSPDLKPTEHLWDELDNTTDYIVPPRYSCTVTPSARETPGARSRYGAARFRARRRFSSEGAVIVGCFARARREKKIRSFQCEILSAPDKTEHREIQKRKGGRARTTCAIVAGVLKAGCSLLGGMAQTNSYGQSSNGVTDESPNMLVYRKVGPSGPCLSTLLY